MSTSHDPHGIKRGVDSESPQKRRKMQDDDFSSENVSRHSIPTSGPIKLYLVQAKLDAQEISELLSLVDRLRDSNGASRLKLCQTAGDADIIVTTVRMRKRLERHIQWDLAKDKAIVTPEWLRNSVKQHTVLPCGDYAALRELKKTTADNCPDSDDNSREDGSSSGKFLTSTQSAELAKAHYTSRYACLRPCPMECPNQQLVQQLGIIRCSRELEGKDTSALSYERAISVLKSYPYLLTPSKLTEVSKLPGIGEKILSKITEYINEGNIKESQSIAGSSRYRSLCAFTTVHGIGASSARKLYDSFGLRTLGDLTEHYNSHPPASRHGNNGRILTPAPTLSIKDALALRADLNETIPRTEVDMMHSIVMAELEEIRPGCLSTIVGGYRRGKIESNDVDLVITHPALSSGSNQVMGLCETLVNRLYKRGLVTHVMHLSGFHPPEALRTSNWDTLEKALTVFILPPEDAPVTGSRRIHRRLDLIFAAPETYWTAVTGWTGSKMFERDLRLWAKKRGMKFDSSGITRRRDSKQYFPHSEEDVFAILGLECIAPTLRNADA